MRRHRILVFGDSNSIRPVLTGRSWPSLLEKKYSNHIQVLNASCDGRTTKYDIGERNGLWVVGSILKAQSPLEYVLIMLGTNDLKCKYGPPPTADIIDGMRRIIDKVKSIEMSATIIILTPPPLGHVKDGDLVGAHQRILSLVSGLTRLSEIMKIKLIDIYSLLDLRSDIESDKIHLNLFGRKKIAEAIFNYLN